MLIMYGGESLGISSDFLRGQVDFLIASVLEEGDNYGYAINNRIEEKSRGEIALTEASMYTSFKRLESDGIVTSYWLDGSNNRLRKYYSLTAKGQEFVKSKREEWFKNVRIMQNFYKGE